MSQESLGEQIYHEVEKIPLVDTHEHLMPEKERQKQQIDFFYFFSHYASSDLVSAGMDPQTLEEIRNPQKSQEARWNKLASYWLAIRNTTYARALMIAARDLFGIQDINEKTWRELSARISASNREGWYREVLKQKARIEISLCDLETTDVDREFFAPVMRFDSFIMVSTRVELEQLERRTGIAIHSLEGLLRALDIAFEKVVSGGAVGVKSGLAYERILRYNKVTGYQAEKVFNRLFGHPGEGISRREGRPLQDYMMHQVIQRAISNNLPIQIHTGLQEGNANIITNAHPAHLVNLFLDYREAKFDIFHGSYPYCSELAVLAKNFPNVYVDMSWLHIISPSAAHRALHEWVETVPGNKIFAFGGDYIFVEGAYAHSRIAREVVSRVLTEKVKEGYLDEKEAVNLAWRILRENPLQIYRLEERSV